MSPAIVKRRLVDEAVADMLNTAIGYFSVTLIDRPADDPDEPIGFFAILYPLPGGEFYGSPLTGPEADASVEYQVTSVGQTAEQAQWVADEVRRVMCDRDEHGVHVTVLTIDEHAVIEREQIPPIGGVTKQEGIYQVVDSYEVCVSRES